jgi:ubiquinone/menaquinone biosynthesis C-methylase UbiE
MLEVGCGSGANIWFMAREGFAVYGVDGSETAIDACQMRLNEEVQNWQGALSVADIQKLSFADNYFDAVLDIEAVYCNSFEQSKIIYAEMVRVLKPGGKFYSRCFATGTIGDKTGELLSYNTYRPAIGPMAYKGMTRFTSREDIVELLPKSLILLEIDQMIRGAPLDNPVIEWCITAEKNHG